MIKREAKYSFVDFDTERVRLAAAEKWGADFMVTRWAKKANVSRPTIIAFMRGWPQVKTTTARKLIEAVGLEPERYVLVDGKPVK